MMIAIMPRAKKLDNTRYYQPVPGIGICMETPVLTDYKVHAIEFVLLWLLLLENIIPGGEGPGTGTT